MRKLYKGVVVGISIIVASFIVAWYLTQSLWFLRGMLGEKQALIEVGYTNISQVKSVLGSAVSFDPAQIIGVNTASFIRCVYIQDSSYEYISVIPTIKNQFQASNALQSAGWGVQRVGWILVGQRPLNGSVKTLSANDNNTHVREFSIFQGLKAQFSMLFQQRVPWNPFIFLKIQAGEYSLGTPISMYATLASAKTMHAYIAFNDIYPMPISLKEQNTQQNSYDLFFSIQRDVLKNSPPQISQALQEFLTTKLHIINSSPDLISAIPDGSSVAIAQRGGNIGLGAVGHGDVFGFNIARMLSQEQGDRHPDRKTFALPDGTMSHEYIPTQPVITFTSHDQQPGCKKADGYDDPFFLCDQDALAVVSSHEDLAHSILSDLSNTFFDSGQPVAGYITSQEVQNILPHSEIDTLQFGGNENFMAIVVKTK